MSNLIKNKIEFSAFIKTLSKLYPDQEDLISKIDDFKRQDKYEMMIVHDDCFVFVNVTYEDSELHLVVSNDELIFGAVKN